MNVHAREVIPPPNPLDPFGFFETALEGSRLATEAFIDQYKKSVRILTQPARLDEAMEKAKAAEQRGDIILPRQADDFGITSTSINGIKIPVKINCQPVSATCDLWHFKCPDRVTVEPPIFLPKAISGGAATNFKHIAAAFLPTRDVIIGDWIDPHLLPASIPFDLDTNTDDIVKCFIKLGAAYPRGFDALAISQAGTPTTAALKLMALEPEKYQGLCPSNVIIAGSPMDTRPPRHFMDYMNWGRDWMMRFAEVSSDIIMPVGKAYKGDRRLMIPVGVMPELHEATEDVPGPDYRPEALPAAHVIQTYQRNFQDNQMARNRWVYRDRIISAPPLPAGCMFIVASNDEFVPRAKTLGGRAIYANATRMDTLELEKAAHYDLLKPGEPLKIMVAAINRFTGVTPMPRG